MKDFDTQEVASMAGFWADYEGVFDAGVFNVGVFDVGVIDVESPVSASQASITS